MKLIALSGKRGCGLYTAVSDEDFDYLSQWRWHSGGGGYAKRGVVNADGLVRTLFLHRVVASRMGLSLSLEVDHRYGDKLDNCRHNLRSATHGQNIANTPVRSTSKTGVKGVYYEAGKKLYRAVICVNKKLIGLGRFKRLEDAKAKRAEACKMYRGEFARFD